MNSSWGVRRRTTGPGVVLTALVVLVVLALAPPATSAATSDSAAAVVQARATGEAAVLRPGRLVYPDGHRQDIAAQGDAMEFSPDGSRIIGVEGSRTLTVYSNDGSQRSVWPLTGPALAVTWSPDGARVAVVVGGTPGSPTRLHSIDLATGAASVLFEDTSNLHIDQNSSIDWDPTGSRIAFVATGHDPATGQLNARELSQLYTVPATGGAPVRFTPAPGPTGAYTVFRNPRWSPTGVMAALISGAGPQYIGLVQEGSSDTPALVHQTGGSGGSQASADTGPFWSADGARLAYGQLPAVATEVKGVPTVIAAAGGAVLGTYRGGNGFTDWQPCPGASCASWPTPRTAVFGVSKKKVRPGAKVVFFGALKSPLADSCSDNEPVELQRAVGRKKPFSVWKRLTSAGNARVNVKAKVKKTARYRLVVAATPVCMGATSAEIKVTVRRLRHR